MRKLLVVAGGLVAARSASADPDHGISLTFGGGVSGFTDKAMRETVQSDVSPLWDLRATVGTRSPIAVDVSYLGSAVTARSLGAQNGTLLDTTFEAAARYNILPHSTVNPYVFAGIGWQRYDVRDMQLATSDTGLAGSDNLLEIPMGVGVAYRDPSGFTFEFRGTFRAAVANANLVSDGSGGYAGMHTWEASAALGWEL